MNEFEELLGVNKKIRKKRAPFVWFPDQRIKDLNTTGTIMKKTITRACQGKSGFIYLPKRFIGKECYIILIDLENKMDILKSIDLRIKANKKIL